MPQPHMDILSCEHKEAKIFKHRIKYCSEYDVRTAFIEHRTEILTIRNDHSRNTFAIMLYNFLFYLS